MRVITQIIEALDALEPHEFRFLWMECARRAQAAEQKKIYLLPKE